jgi:hypothetical protein
MPIDIALHPLGNPNSGNHPVFPGAPVLFNQDGLAEATPSGDIIVPPGGATLVVTATVKVRLDIQLAANATDPSTSGIVLIADRERAFALAKGTYKVESAVYA